MLRTLPIAAVIAFTPLAHAQTNLFDPARTKPALVIVSLSPDTPDPAQLTSPQSSPMLARLDGVLATIATSKDIEDLRRAVGAFTTTPPKAEGTRFAIVHSFGPQPKDATSPPHKAIEILRMPDGTWTAQELADPGEKAPKLRRATFKPDALAPLTLNWSALRTDPRALAPSAKPQAPSATPHKPTEIFELERPYTPAALTLTRKALADRLHAGQGTSLEDTKRDLATEKLSGRLPKDWNPSRAAGLLVWIGAVGEDQPPLPIHEAADALNLIIVSAANSGNDRPVQDRYQLALDGVATISSRYLVDPERVYVTGISGGGRVSSILTACFPDVFRGAAPIVGLSCFENVPIGDGRFWPAAFSKPLPARWNLLKTHRIAPISGDKDFNYNEIVSAISIYTADGCQAKLFNHPGMGHQMPQPAWFTEALSWVDEPQSALNAKHLAEADAELKAWQAARAKQPKGTPLSTTDRETLAKVTRLAPWTEPAWKAVESLRAP